MGKLDVVWAPWRLSYVTADDSSSGREHDRKHDGEHCFICQAVVDSETPERFVVGQSEQTIAILNRFPYNNGHLLVAPRLHCPSLNTLTPSGRAELTEQINRWVNVLDEVLHPEGFNVGLNLGRVAGAGLPGHLHWHIVPRWHGDTNFMAAISDTKVIPQSLHALWEVIREHIVNHPQF